MSEPLVIVGNGMAAARLACIPELKRLIAPAGPSDAEPRKLAAVN